VTHFLLLILVLLGGALYFMTPVERTRLLRASLTTLRNVKEAATLERLQGDPFFEALRARTPRLIATPSLLVLGATIYIVLLALGVGPRTTSGEGWRLVTTMFVHSRALDLFVNVVCLWQIGLILERLVGRPAFITVYVASGVSAGIASLSASPGGLSVGASGSVLGLYGVLLVTSIWSMIHRSSLTIPLNVLKGLAPAAAIFFLYRLTTTGFGSVAELASLVCGLVGGIVVARDVNERTPQIRHLATAMATVVTVVTLYAVVVLHRPPNETIDVRPEIDRVIAVEDRTAGLYDKEVDRFRKGRITAAALADVIEKTIVPELQVVAGRLRALQDVSPEHQPLVATAEKFLKLRDESWQLRAVALHKSDMLGFRQADSKEQASREAFHRLKTPLPDDSSPSTF
jgi:membrane associated rhomboid family serine protease